MLYVVIIGRGGTVFGFLDGVNWVEFDFEVCVFVCFLGLGILVIFDVYFFGN